MMGIKQIVEVNGMYWRQNDLHWNVLGGQFSNMEARWSQNGGQNEDISKLIQNIGVMGMKQIVETTYKYCS